MHIKNSVSIIAFFVSMTLSTLSAQYIVQIEEGYSAQVLQSIANRSPYNHSKVLDEKMGFFLVNSSLSKSDLLKIPQVLIVEEEGELEKRATPNDDLYSNQYSMDLIGMRSVWETITDAVDFGGREVVVAILDDGFQVDHEDLRNNIFINSNEIPDNGLDDDGNGLIDDVRGWNIDTNNDDHDKETHGTSVAGIIGAEGDNNIGVAGVSWKVKILPISGINLKSEIIQGFAKIRDLRDLYNKTNGEKGAYIVVTNYSGGISEAFAEDNELWCGQYDALGAVGVLSVGATTNRNDNVEVVGDMPSTCTSPFLIVTTNTNANDSKVSSAGFGEISVDIGAPGDNVVTTNIADGYKEFKGTSASAPHVAGAAALLFSTPCPTFNQLTIDNPENAALAVKNAIFDSAKPIDGLVDISTTGGRLNVDGAFKLMQTLCGGSSGDLAVSTISPNPVREDESLTVKYQTPDSEPYSLRITNVMGQTVYREIIYPPFFGDKINIIPMNKGWLPGIYILSIYNDQSISSSKFYKD